MKVVEEDIVENITKKFKKTIYVCDVEGCGYKCDTCYSSKIHDAHHAAKKHCCIGETDFYYFEAKKDIDVWAEGQGKCFFNNKFVGSGWYGAIESHKYECGEIEDGIDILYVDYFKNKWRQDIDRMSNDLQKLKEKLT